MEEQMGGKMKTARVKESRTSRTATKTGFREQLNRKVPNGIPDGLRGRF